MRIELIILAVLVLIPLSVIASSVSVNESVVLVNITANDSAINESDPKYWLDEGWDIFYSGKYDEALQVFDKATELDPQDISAWHAKGYVLFDSGKYEESIKALDRCIELDPGPHSGGIPATYIESQYYKGLALYALGRDSEAKAAFREIEYMMPAWMEFVTFHRGEGFDGLLILYNDYDSHTASGGWLRVELYEDRDYTKKVWSKSFDVNRDDFDSYTWGLGREDYAWRLKRIAFEDIKPGMEDPVYLYVRAYFDTLDGRTLKDTTMI